jgi:hypothetical protein
MRITGLKAGFHFATRLYGIKVGRNVTVLLDIKDRLYNTKRIIGSLAS